MPSLRKELLTVLSSDSHKSNAELGALRELLQASEGNGTEDLRESESELFDYLIALAEDEHSTSKASQCLFLYGKRLAAFPSVWRRVLTRISAALPFQRLRTHLRIIREIIGMEGAETLRGHTTHILNALLGVLESTRRVELLPEIVGILSSVAERSPTEFGTSFQDSVDLLLGWAVDVTLPDDYRDLISSAFASFHEQWRAASPHRTFALSLQRKLLADMRKMAVAAPQVAESGRLHALLHCFYGISGAMGNLGDIHDSAAPVLLQCLRFYTRQMACQPVVAVRDLRMCAYIHLACVREAGEQTSTSSVREMLESSAFSCLRVFLDQEIRRLVLKTYLAFLYECGPSVKAFVLQAVTKEFTTLSSESPNKSRSLGGSSLSVREVESLLAFDAAVLRRVPDAIPAFKKAIAQCPARSAFLCVCLWDAAGAALKTNVTPDLDDLLHSFRDLLEQESVPTEPLLRSIQDASAVFWRCFGESAWAALLPLLWRSRGAVAARRRLLVDVALALCPLDHELGASASLIYVTSLQPCLPELLDVNDGEGDESQRAQVAAKSATLRVRLGVLCGHLGQSGQMPQASANSSLSAALAAPHLRSLLPAAAPLGATALVHFLSALRILQGNANIPALFWVSASAPKEIPVTCQPLWMVLQAASYFVSHRLKSPVGSASSSLHFLETLLFDALTAVGTSIQAFVRAAAAAGGARVSSKALSDSTAARVRIHTDGFQPLACVQLVYLLDHMILLAQEPIHITMRPQLQLHSKTTCQFFDANRRVCGDWFQRMRGVARQTLARYGSHPAHYMISLARLADLLRQLVPVSCDTPLSLLVLADLSPHSRTDAGIERASGGRPEGSPVDESSGSLLSGSAWTKGVEPDGVVDSTQSAPRKAQGFLVSSQAGITSSRALEGLEHNLVPLLSSALALRSVGLCRGVFALYGHAAYALNGSAFGLCQDALLAFAAQSYEEAAMLFSRRLGAREQCSQNAPLGLAPSSARSAQTPSPRPAESGSRALQALMARTWLEAAMLSRDVAEVEYWLRTYEGSARVSPAMRSFATSYTRLLRGDATGCLEAVDATLHGALDEWSQGETAERAPPQMHESVCRLSRWADLSNVFLVEASVSAQTPGGSRMTRALGDARSCLQADLLARAHCEPCLTLIGPDAFEPTAASLELISDIERAARGGRRSLAPGTHDLHHMASFNFPLESEADSFRLVKHCVRTRNFRLASSVLNSVEHLGSDVGARAVETAMLNSMILEAQQRVPEAFHVLHKKLALVLSHTAQLQADSPSASQWLSQELLAQTSLQNRVLSVDTAEKCSLLLASYMKLLGNRGSEIAAQWPRSCLTAASFSGALTDLRERVIRVHGHRAADLREQSPFAQSFYRRHMGRQAGTGEWLEPLQSVGDSSSQGQVNPQFLGWLSLQGCLLCPTSTQLWSRYGDWLYSQRSALDLGQVEQLVAAAVETQGTGTQSPLSSDELRVLCRCVRDSVRRWMHHDVKLLHARDGEDHRSKFQSESLWSEWFSKSSVRTCGPWNALGAASQNRLAMFLEERCKWLREWQGVAGAECLRAYFRHLQLEDVMPVHPKTQRMLLRILRVFAESENIGSLLSEGSPTSLPAAVWEPLLPQILAYMRHPSPDMSVLAAELFSVIAKAFPRIAIFPALASETPGGVGGGVASSTATSPLRLVAALHPEVLRNGELFARLLNVMATPVDEICARCLQYAETFLAGKAGFQAADGIALVISRFSGLLAVLDSATGEDRAAGTSENMAQADSEHRSCLVVEHATEDSDPGAEMLSLMGVRPCLRTAYARRFLATFLPALRQMLFLHRPYVTGALTEGAIVKLRHSVLSHLRSLLRSCGHSSRVSSVSLQDLAPGLVEMFDGENRDKHEVVLPIQDSPSGPELLRVCRVSQKVHLLSTKTKPKKLDIEGPDGTCHVFLLKGRDDLRLDKGIMQLLQAINTIIATDQCSSRASAGGLPVPTCPAVPLRCRDYDVVPIAPRAGLIRWVQAVPLFSIHKQRRHLFQEQQLERGGEDKKLLVESSTDLWHKKVRQHLQAMDVNMDTTPRKLWPIEALRKTYAEMQADSPADLISRELLLSSLHPTQHFTRSVAYTLSTALMSVVGYLIGLGDRHLDNVLLDLATGEIVHVDYSICFDRGMRLKVPEKVPFRLTRCMVSALGPMGVSGLFLQTMETGLGLLREWRELVVSLVEPCFLLAPVNDWVHPVTTPFKLGETSGGLVCRLCKSLTEEWPEASSAATDVARTTDVLGRLVSQCDVVLDAQSRHTGLKVHMTKDVKMLIDLEQRKSKAVVEGKVIEEQLQKLKAEESTVRDALDMKVSELQTYATRTVAAMLDRQRKAVCVLLDPCGQSLPHDVDDPLVQAYQRLLPLESVEVGPPGLPLTRAAADTVSSLLRVQSALVSLSEPVASGSNGLPGSGRELVMWSLLMHSPHKVYIDELCGSGLLQASAVWWPPGGAEAVKQVDINLGRSAEGSVVTRKVVAEDLQSLIPAWGLESSGERARQLLHDEWDIAALLQRLDDWTSDEGVVGSSRSSEIINARAEAKDSLQDDMQKMLRPQGIAAIGGRTTGLQRRRLSGILLACLREAAEVFEEMKALCHKNVSEFGLSACLSQAMDQGYVGASPPPGKVNARAQLQGLPMHGQFLVIVARVAQVVQVLLHANVIDFGHNLASLAHHWLEVAEALVNVEAATVAASAVRLHSSDIVSNLANREWHAGKVEPVFGQDGDGPPAADSNGVASEWPSLEVSTKGSKHKEKQGSGKQQSDQNSSIERLCQEVHCAQEKLRHSLHPSTPSHRCSPGVRSATLLGLPKVKEHCKWLEALVEHRQQGKQLCSEVLKVRAMSPGNVRDEATQQLSRSIGALRSRSSAVMQEIDDLLKVNDARQELSQASRILSSEIHETVAILEDVTDSLSSAQMRNSAWERRDPDRLPGLYSPNVLPEHLGEVLRAQSVPSVDWPFSSERGHQGEASSRRQAPGQAVVVDLMLAQTEVELLLSTLATPDAPILITAGVELARFTSHGLFPCFSQVLSYLFGFLLEQLHSFQDLSSISIQEPSVNGIIAAVSVLGIDPTDAHDVSQLCARQAHVAMLMRRQQMLAGVRESARKTSLQARSQYHLLQWCHFGSFLSFEAVHQSTQRNVDVGELTELKGLLSMEPQNSCEVAGARPDTVVRELFESHARLRKAIQESVAQSQGGDVSRAGHLVAFAGDILRLFIGVLGQSGDTPCVTDHAWVRTACSSLQVLNDNLEQQSDLSAKLQDLFVAVQGSEQKDSMSMLGNEAMLANTLQEISIEGERLDAMRLRTQQELDAFLTKHRVLFSSALGLAQPLEGCADGLRLAASSVVSPLVHFRKVLDNKELRDLSSNHPLTASALNDLRELPANVTCLLQQCEAWLNPKSENARPPAPRGTMTTASGRTLPLPPMEAVPPPPPLPKEIDDVDDTTAGAGSGDLSDEEDSQDEGAESPEEGDTAAVRSEETAEEEEQLAQDKEEMSETQQREQGNALSSPELNASSEEEASGSGEREVEAAWRAQALYSVKSISRKIPKSNANLSQRAEALVAKATSPDDLSQMYEGWTAWI